MKLNIKKSSTYLLLVLIFGTIISACGSSSAKAVSSSTSSSRSTSSTMHLYPPWNPSPAGGEHFTVPGVDNMPDFHGNPIAATGPNGLVVFEAGNQFMVLPKLMTAFRKAYPQVKHIYYETLPPGILFKQVQKGSIVVGNLRLKIKPDVITAGLGRMQKIYATGQVGPYYVYAQNSLTLEVYKNNPKKITGLKSLARPGIKISMPNPAWEGVAKQIKKAYVKAGGKKLLNTVMKTKLKNGQTFLTHIHHRQSPIRIMEKKSNVAPVWITEALFQQRIGNPISYVPIPPSQNVTAKYNISVFKNAPHQVAAKDFYNFMKSPTAQNIYKSYGFVPGTPKQLNTTLTKG